jgi:hypothetical protein
MKTIEKILVELHPDEYLTFQREAMQAAILQKEDITMELLKIIEQVTNNPKLNKKIASYKDFKCALLLLAQLREDRAYPLIVKFLGQLDKYDHHFFSSELGQILASVCHGEISLIKNLIEDQKVNSTVRYSALYSLVTLFNNDLIKREELIDYFQTLFYKLEEEKDPGFWEALVESCERIYPRELYFEISNCFNSYNGILREYDSLEESTYCSVLDGKEKALENLKADSRFQFIDNAIANWMIAYSR